jgi:hypothetical protein
MADDDNLFDRARSRISEALAPTQDGNPSPQARDERPTVVGREEHREEVDGEQVEQFVDEYFVNPLVRVPVQNFASDVTEPGYSVIAEAPEDEEVPTVEYEGRELPLDEAINEWLSSCFIDGFSFDGDFSTLLRQVVIDRRGRRGTAIVEHAYDDPREREKLMKLKPVKMETVTAYVREGKGIALRPDDEPNEFESVAVNDYGDVRRDAAPTTPAGNTAAIAQFDDVFGAQEREEIPFALDDLTVSSHDADTGALFGRPDSSSIINRAQALRKKLRHVDQSVVNTSFGNVIAKVETQSAEVVREVQDNLNPNVRERGERGDVDTDPQTVSATNADVDLNELDASVPDVEGIIQQEIEYIISAMPTPLYRIGFTGDVNRDISSEQSEDYRDTIKRERRRLESDFEPMLKQKARELLFGDAHADEKIGVTLDLRIRPEQAESPLRDEEFSPQEFSQTMSGLKAAAPGGAVEKLVPPHEIREMFLDIDPEQPDPPESETDDVPQPAELSLPDETDPQVQKTFRDAYLQGEPFADNPVLPDDLETLSEAWVNRWAEWIAAGRPDIPESEQLSRERLEFIPAKHPRNPKNGKFVERSFNVPDDAPDFGDMNTADTLGYISENGGDLDSTVFDSESAVTVDGIPNDATGLNDIGDGDIDDSNRATRVKDRVEAEFDSDAADREIRAAVEDTLNEEFQEFDVRGFRALNNEQVRGISSALSSLDEAGEITDEKIPDTFGGIRFGYPDEGNDNFADYRFTPDEDSVLRVYEGLSDERVTELISDGWLNGTEDVNGIERTIVHEWGHVRHHAELANSEGGVQQGVDRVNSLGLSGEDAETITNEISEYAAHNGWETVAEEYTRRAYDIGDSPSEQVQGLYDYLGGPDFAESLASLRRFSPPRGGSVSLSDHQPEELPPELQSESDAVVETFKKLAERASEQLATRYAEGDVVQSPQGLGVITGVETEPFSGKDSEVDASESSPTYVVGLKDARVGVGFYSASELDSEEMPDTGVDEPEEKLTPAADTDTDTDDDDDAELLETTFDIPESWDESPKPNRLILLDAWSSMGGTFSGARRELGSKELAASMKDRVLQWEGWRG